MMSYKGYQAVLKYDDEAEIFHGEVVGTRDVIFFEGTSVEDLNREFQSSIDDYLDLCAERGHEPDKPFTSSKEAREFFQTHNDSESDLREPDWEEHLKTLRESRMAGS